MTPDQENLVRLTAHRINELVWMDSRVYITLDAMSKVLMADVEAGAPVPTHAQCEQLVMGGDDGEVPPELVHRYPRLDLFLRGSLE